MDDEILTIRELAALIWIGKKTACTMAQSGERFRRADIDAWIDKQVRSSDESDVANQREEDP